MAFYSRTNKPATIAYPKSEKTIPTFSLEIDKTTGKKTLKETGKTNIYDKIQASAEQTKIYNILDRFNAGDIDAINKVKGHYGDFTNLPRTLAEAQQQLINAEKLFYQQPLEVRQEFNHNPAEFFAAAASGDVLTRVEKVAKKMSKAKEDKLTEETAQTSPTAQNSPISTPVQPISQPTINNGGIM